MTAQYEIEKFRARVVDVIQRFRQLEETIRAEHARIVAGAPATQTASPDRLQERRTRRFLVDGFLAALGWDPNDPQVVSEEARAAADDGDRLYLDYLGLAPQTQFPVVIIEAKGLDLPLPGGARGAAVDSRDVVPLIVDELKALKRGETTGGVSAQWTEWLRNMRRYVGALSSPTLSRVVITAGQWFVVFKDPKSAFIEGQVRQGDVFCFANFADIEDHHAELFALLGRERVVDTLPPVLDIGQALQVIRPLSVSEYYRAVAVATRTTGTARRQYPTRSVYPGMVVLTGGRYFGIFNWGKAVEEPRCSEDESRYCQFLKDLQIEWDRLHRRVVTSWGRSDLEVSSLETFRGFPLTKAQSSALEILPAVGSTADQIGPPNEPQRRLVVVPITVPTGEPEYLVVTGLEVFYKCNSEDGTKCDFHLSKKARAMGIVATECHVGPGARSFTEDGQAHHCAHEDLRSRRKSRCQLRVLESHMCCRTCVFHSDCWMVDSHILPCPVS